MNEELRAALIALGLRLNGAQGAGPTASQWDRNRLAGTPRAGTIARLCLGKVERFTFEVWVEVLALVNLRYPPGLLTKVRVKDNSDCIARMRPSTSPDIQCICETRSNVDTGGILERL